MKQIRILLAFLAPCLVLLLLASSPASAQTEEKTFTVRGNQDWVDTDIGVMPTDKVTFSATGSICFTPRNKSACVGPGGMGQDAFEDRFPYLARGCKDPARRIGHGALVGKLVGYNTYFFSVSNAGTIIGKQGTILIGINDCELPGNTGEFEVTITIERNAYKR